MVPVDAPPEGNDLEQAVFAVTAGDWDDYTQGTAYFRSTSRAGGDPERSTLRRRFQRIRYAAAPPLWGARGRRSKAVPRRN